MPDNGGQIIVSHPDQAPVIHQMGGGAPMHPQQMYQHPGVSMGFDASKVCVCLYEWGGGHMRRHALNISSCVRIPSLHQAGSMPVDASRKPPVEFNHAINYVNKIKVGRDRMAP